MTRRMLYSFLAVVTFLSTAQAQIGDWADVQDLPSNTTIFVQAGHKRVLRCTFEGATDSVLSCAIVFESPYVPPREISFERSEVRRVMVEDSHEDHAVKGALIGAGIGAALGAIVGTGKNSSARAGLGVGLVFGSIGLALGDTIGSNHQTTRQRVLYAQ